MGACARRIRAGSLGTKANQPCHRSIQLCCLAHTLPADMNDPHQASMPVTRAAVITHGKADAIGPALARLQAVADAAGVQIVVPPEEALKHGVDAVDGDGTEVDIAVVLGGD